MLARILHLTGVTDLGVIAAVASVPHAVFQKIETGFRRGQCSLLADALLRQRAEKPQLPRLQHQELFARANKLTLAQRLEVAAVCRIDAGRKVEVHQTVLKDAPAALGLIPQSFSGG